MKNKIIKIFWKDAQVRDIALDLDDIKKINLVNTISIGYLIDENKERIAICPMIFLEEEILTGFRNTQFIPKSQIEKVIELK
jgi:hypothetical protein